MNLEQVSIKQCAKGDAKSLARLLAVSFPYVFEGTLGLSRKKTIALLAGLMKLFGGRHYWGYRQFYTNSNTEGEIISLVAFSPSSKQVFRKAILAIYTLVGLLFYSGLSGLNRAIRNAMKNSSASPGIHKGELYISYIAVDEGYRGKGLGKQSLDFAIEFAKESDFKSVGLDVRENNSAALSLFEASGFETIETIDDKAFNGVPRLYMRKVLS